MSPQIKIPRYLQRKTSGDAIVEANGATVRQCIQSLIREYPGLQGEIMDPEGRLLLKWMIYVNDDVARVPNELSHPVRGNDTISLVPVINGG